MASLLDDVNYALRMWRRHPGFVATAVLTLALGIGANTTMFSMVTTTLLRELPFPKAGRLMTIWKSGSWPNVQNVQARVRSIVRVAVFDSASLDDDLGGGDEPEQVSGCA